MSVRIVAPTAREGLAHPEPNSETMRSCSLPRVPHPQDVRCSPAPASELAAHKWSRHRIPRSNSRILAELGRLRGLLPFQLAGFAWSAGRRRDPAGSA